MNDDGQRLRQAVIDFRAQFKGVENLWTIGESKGCDLLDEMIVVYDALDRHLEAVQAQRIS